MEKPSQPSCGLRELEAVKRPLIQGDRVVDLRVTKVTGSRIQTAAVFQVRHVNEVTQHCSLDADAMMRSMSPRCSVGEQVGLHL